MSSKYIRLKTNGREISRDWPNKIHLQKKRFKLYKIAIKKDIILKKRGILPKNRLAAECWKKGIQE